MPRWLGEIYSRLYVQLEDSLFTLEQAKRALGLDRSRLNVAFSKLHSRRVLTVFERSRPRLYRIIEPNAFILLASETIINVERVPQERYLPLILHAYTEASKNFKLRSFAVYGSVARGAAREDSDVDLLVISDDFKGSIGQRLERLLVVENSLQDELEWLSDHGFYTGLSFYPLRSTEAERLPDLFLDLTDDAIILWDEGEFLGSLLSKLKAKLVRSGARRVFVDRENWYWDLKPDYRFGEIVEVP